MENANLKTIKFFERLYVCIKFLIHTRTNLMRNCNINVGFYHDAKQIEKNYKIEYLGTRSNL